MALEHAETQRQFGPPIGSFQAVQMQIADMAIGIAARRQMTLSRRLAARARRTPAQLEGRHGKGLLYGRVSEGCLRTTHADPERRSPHCEDNDMSRWINMALLGPVGMGSNNMQHSIMAGMLGLQLHEPEVSVQRRAPTHAAPRCSARDRLSRAPGRSGFKRKACLNCSMASVVRPCVARAAPRLL